MSVSQQGVVSPPGTAKSQAVPFDVHTQPGSPHLKRPTPPPLRPPDRQTTESPYSTRNTLESPYSKRRTPPGSPRNVRVGGCPELNGSSQVAKESPYDIRPPPRESPYGTRPLKESPYGTRPPPESPYGTRPLKESPYGTRPPPESPYGTRPPPESPYGTRPPPESPYGTRPPPESPYGTRPPQESPYGTRPPPESPYGTRPPPESPYGTGLPSESPYGTRPPPESPYGTRPPPESPYGTRLPPESPYGTKTIQESPYGIRLPPESPYGTRPPPESPYGTKSSQESPYGTRPLPESSYGTKSSSQESPYGSRHIPVETWLGALDLMEYQSLFESFKGVEDLLLLTEGDIRDLGVRNQAHRARMVSTLILYKDKLNKKMNRGLTPKSSTPRSGTPPTVESLTPPSLLDNNPDYATVQVQNAPHFTAANVAQVLMGNLRDQPTMKELAQFAWYHGSIPRQNAEQLVTREGHFLVRDSTSKPGEFVLTLCWKGAPLHFVLNKRVTGTSPNNPPLIQYQFEEDLFEKPTDLILHYLDDRKPITQLSGAVISSPVIRSVPLEFYDPRPPSPYQGRSPRNSPWTSPGPSPLSSPLMQRKAGRTQRAGSQPILSLDDDSSEPSMNRKGSMPALLQKFSVPSNSQVPAGLSRNQSSPKPERRVPLHHRTGSEPSLVTKDQSRPRLSPTGSEELLTKPPPPKPSRVPTIKKLATEKRPTVQVRNKDLYDDDGRDYSDYDQIKSWPAALQRSEKERGSAKSQSVHQEILRNSNKPNLSMYDVPKNPFRNAQFMYDVPKSVRSAISNQTPGRDDHKQYTLPEMNAPSNFDLSRYDSELLTPNNKPLEPSAVTTIKSLLLDSRPKFMAQHLTVLDLQLLKITGSVDLGLGVTSGLELMTLPQGHRLRQDLIDRYHCMGLFVALTILMCSHPSDRTQMLHQWIQIAVELRGAMGNMYSFSAIMAGLGAKQITRLKDTWACLKQRHSESSFMYEQRLWSLNQALDNASATLPLQNITVPHIIPLVRLLERDFTDIGSLMSWEEDRPDFGLDTMLAHLDTIRIVTQQCGLYRVTADNMLREFEVRRDLADLFRTEMHQKLLWGARGASVNVTERLSKFPAVLDLLSQRVEPGPENALESSV